MNTLYYATLGFVSRWTPKTGFEARNLRTDCWEKISDPSIGKSIAIEGTQIYPAQVDHIHALFKKILCPSFPSTKQVMLYVPPPRTLMRCIIPKI
jgi:hypothetical protein